LLFVLVTLIAGCGQLIDVHVAGDGILCSYWPGTIGKVMLVTFEVATGITSILLVRQYLFHLDGFQKIRLNLGVIDEKLERMIRISKICSYVSLSLIFLSDALDLLLVTIGRLNRSDVYETLVHVVIVLNVFGGSLCIMMTYSGFWNSMFGKNKKKEPKILVDEDPAELPVVNVPWIPRPFQQTKKDSSDAAVGSTAVAHDGYSSLH